MSKSWTPQELYNADKYITRTTGHSMREQRLYFIQPDGTKIPVESNDDIKIRKQFKELGFLYDKLPETYRCLNNHPKYRNRVLKEIEYKLERYVIHNNSKGNDTDAIWLWYIGRLDSNFYYNEQNNELLHQYIVNEVDKLVKSGGKQDV